MKRYFENTTDNHNKFWEITIHPDSYTTRYGKIGQTGNSTTKQMLSHQDASVEAYKIVQAKIKKGYKEIVRYDFDQQPTFADVHQTDTLKDDIQNALDQKIFDYMTPDAYSKDICLVTREVESTETIERLIRYFERYPQVSSSSYNASKKQFRITFKKAGYKNYLESRITMSIPT